VKLTNYIRIRKRLALAIISVCVLVVSLVVFFFPSFTKTKIPDKTETPAESSESANDVTTNNVQNIDTSYYTGKPKGFNNNIEWKEYTNAFLGYSIKYPPEYSINGNNQILSISNPSLTRYARTEISSGEENSYIKAEIYVSEKTTDFESPKIENIISNSKITVDGKVANHIIYKIPQDDASSQIHLIEIDANEKFYKIFLYAGKSVNLDTFWKIIDTFKVLDWKTYSNTNLGIKFSYPSELNLEENKDGSVMLTAKEKFKFSFRKFDTKENTPCSYLYEQASLSIVDIDNIECYSTYQQDGRGYASMTDNFSKTFYIVIRNGEMLEIKFNLDDKTYDDYQQDIDAILYSVTCANLNLSKFATDLCEDLSE